MAGLTTGFQLTAQQAKMLDELKGYLDQNFPAEPRGPDPHAGMGA